MAAKTEKKQPQSKMAAIMAYQTTRLLFVKLDHPKGKQKWIAAPW